MQLYLFFLSFLFPCITSVPVYHNSGTLNGWDFHWSEHKGSIEESNIDYFAGPTSLKFTQKYDPKYYGRYHSEVQVTDAASMGEKGYYGFAFMLDKDWVFDHHMYTISQFITSFKGNNFHLKPTFVYFYKRTVS